MSETALYVRVSSKSQSYEMQVDAIERLGVKGQRIYAEKMSAKTTDRPELKRLLADARAGLIAHLWLFRLDRLTRSGVADTFKVVDELRKAGVTLHTVADGLTIKPGEDVTSDVLVFALGLAASLERTAINDRIAASRTATEARGEAWGRPQRMTPALIESAIRMRSEGRTVREVAAALGVPRSTVARAVASSAAAARALDAGGNAQTCAAQIPA